MKALILSAGLGTRLRPVTNHIPKPAVPFLGIPIALYAVEYALQLGATEIYLNTFYLADELKTSLKPHLDKAQIPYHFIDEKGEILGSGGGLKNIQEHFSDEEHIILCNGDEIILPKVISEFEDFKKHHIESGSTSSLFCIEHPEAGKAFGGVWTNDKNEIIGFGKKEVQNSTKVFHYTGLSLFSPKIWQHLPEGESNILYDAVISSIKNKELNTSYQASANWYETGNEKDFIRAHKEILEFWELSNNDILKSALKRFGTKKIIRDLLDSPKPEGVLGSDLEPQSDTWNIVLDENLSQDKLKLIKNCIVIDSNSEDIRSENLEDKILI